MTSHFRKGVPLALLVTALSACGGSNTPAEPEDPVPTTLTLSDSAVDFGFLGQSRRVSATVLDQSGSAIQGAVSWSTADESVATVTQAGVIRAEANGTTTVEASAGDLTETVAVTVEQVASFVAAVSGDDQDGLAGTELAEPIVAMVQDQGGAPVEGVEVTFTPGQNSGSVDPSSGTSGADGTVSTTWTLDETFGPQTVVAAIESAEVEFSAFGGSDTPTPDLLLPDPVRVTRSDPTSLDPVTVTTTVRNQGDAEATGFRVQLLVDGVELGSSEVATLGASSEQEVSFDVAPMAAGTRAVEVVVDPDGAVLELNETNNEAQKDVVVLLQQVVEPGSSVSALSGEAGDDLLFRVEVAGGPANLTVDLSGGTGDVDLWIEAGDRPRSRTDYDDCISDGPTMEETCQLPEADGFVHVIVHAPQNPPGTPQGFSNSTLTVTVGDPVVPFDLELVFIDNGTESQDQAFLDAATVWNGIIIGDIPDFDLGDSEVTANACIDGQPATRGVVDDVIVYVAIRTIDGPGGALARAGPCAIRNGSKLAFVGIMEFDQADLERLELDGDMDDVVLHEMGHVLGLGTIWNVRGLLQAPSTGVQDGECAVTNPDADTHFTGELTRQAFDAAGGVDYPNAKVPVANGEFGAGCGSADGHWRESVMDTELMTPFIDGLMANPLSAITVQSLADLGYPVDPAQADPYSLPSPQQASAAPAAPGASGLVDLRGDIYQGPVIVMEQGGRVVRVLR